MKKLFLVCLFLNLITTCFSQDITQGLWLNEEKDAKVQFYKQGDKYFGKIVWLKIPNDKEGKPQLDKNNPNDKLKSQPLLNMVFLKNFKYDGKDKWEDGEIYDPKNGKTYASKMTLVSPKLLDVRGFIGFSFIGRTTHWTKMDYVK